MIDKPHASGKVPAGDVTQRVGIEVMEDRGVNVEELREKLIDAVGAEFTTYYYYTILRMYLAGSEDYKEICEDARLEDRAHFELMTPRIYELGGSIPFDIRQFADRAGCPDAYLPGTENGSKALADGEGPEPAEILEVLLEAERCAIRTWSEICDLTLGKDPRTYDLASRILHEEIEHEAWFIELLSKERDGVVRPSGHFRRGEPGDAPFSKNRPIYNPQLRQMGQSYRVSFEYPDGGVCEAAVGEDEHVLAAARHAGLELPSLCEQGWDLACAAKILAGELDNSDARRYYDQDREGGFALICTAKPCSDLRLRTHQTEAMREHREAHGLPAPKGT